MFKKARLKLTAWYLLIIMFVSIAFSLVIYQGLMSEVHRFLRIQRSRIERLFPPNPAQPFFVDEDLITEIQQRIIFGLGIINTIIFITSGALGYFLAGKTLKPIQEMVEEQNRFISDASHEFRTPLTALKSSLEVNLRDKNLSIEEAKKIMSENINDVNHLQKLSDSLLQLSQYEKPQIYSNFEKVSLKQIIEESINKIAPLAKNKNILIKTNLVNVNLKGNKFSLIDLFVILLDNAVKYSGKKSTIVINAKKIDHSVLISIEDQGIGIDKKDTPYLFDRFYRSDKARSKKGIDGYGLGLSIAKKIMNQHKGSIKIKSKLKKGTTVVVNLPIFS
ncbi:MAG: Histidine kinase [Candidatus Roizmanbacteria bacterium GW2011_GWA2_34_18]|uniref:histidine kinase n=1 Tax=Candidatus Roizmanbacteria bacterium GW2011_GWA2_34_18 TaxID=1618477 RepID=A0A0G0B693_9BACT|nr:MAG: Histidine kinase [Candidatus Roizmanbacteria bacterium GW2011_GWA2_34_18]